jgi:hypothetical protein
LNDKLNTALDLTLAALSSPAGALINPAVPAGAMALAKLRRVLQAGVAAHEAATGERLNMDALHQIEPVEVPPEAEGEPI